MRRIKLRYGNLSYERYQPVACRRSLPAGEAGGGWHVALHQGNIVMGTGEILSSDEMRFGAYFPNEWVELVIEEQGGEVRLWINDNLYHSAYYNEPEGGSQIYFGFDPQIPRFSFVGRLHVDEDAEIEEEF